MISNRPHGDMARPDPIAPRPRIGFWSRFRTRMMLWLVALSLSCSVVAGYVYYRQQTRFVQREQLRRGRTLASSLAGQSELGAYSHDPVFLRTPARRTDLESDVSFVTIYDRAGNVLLRMVKPEALGQPSIASEMLSQLRSDTAGRVTNRQQQQHVDFFAPILSVQDDAEQGLYGGPLEAEPSVLGIAHVGISRQPAREKLRKVLIAGISVAAVVLALGLLVALLISARLSRPVLKLAQGAEAIRAGQLGYQLDLNRTDELGVLADSFNGMSAELQRTVDRLAYLNRNLEEEVNRRTVTLRRSRDFMALLNAPLQLDLLLESSLDALLLTPEVRAGAVYLPSIEAPHPMQLAVALGASASAFQLEAPAAADVLQRAIAAERPLLVEHPEILAPIGQQQPDVRTFVLAPLRYRDQMEGVVALAMQALPTQDELEFIDNAASQLAIAVSNAKAYAAAEKLTQELEDSNAVLRQQRDQLRQVSQLKSEFLANISHELRTPLNAVIGYAELLSDGIYGDVNEDQVQSLKGIAESATHLLGLINDILDLSKVEAGKMTVDLEDIDIRQLAEEVIGSTQSLLREKPFIVDAVLPTRPVSVRTDVAKVRQILVNLLSNAIKFTEKGSVTVRLATTSDQKIRIDVQDTGVGIRKEHLSLIFDQFLQVDGSSTRKHGGTGLGLAISKQLAELLGGEILVESAWGAGSTFSVVLPPIAPLLAGG